MIINNIAKALLLVCTKYTVATFAGVGGRQRKRTAYFAMTDSWKLKCALVTVRMITGVGGSCPRISQRRLGPLGPPYRPQRHCCNLWLILLANRSWWRKQGTKLTVYPCPLHYVKMRKMFNFKHLNFQSYPMKNLFARQGIQLHFKPPKKLF